eukprot:CAMPEP_0117050752 /NCGR_PEP_ID=MMETSP0472-20121206/35043_1 /TAXON_ID=693140 ORGANISM="Tiarina fusus, Strain LIS" /NCGR_SAMPLE_ID=MMETSP0472 /ASSEMBLY_ACC=CAM_ASM_000603 /LENGTH=516 /DNA_ID=CAMNT_0004764657 /DNA_START=65 /DNA_END=1615 /DNA_ORIENTATION=-
MADSTADSTANSAADSTTNSAKSEEKAKEIQSELPPKDENIVFVSDESPVLHDNISADILEENAAEDKSLPDTSDSGANKLDTAESAANELDTSDSGAGSAETSKGLVIFTESVDAFDNNPEDDPGNVTDDSEATLPAESNKRKNTKITDKIMAFAKSKPAAKKTGNLLVQVLSGRTLASKDSNGLSDPWVRLTLRDAKGNSTKGSERKTAVISKSLNPEWNESFSIPLNEKHCSLKVECWDKDKLSNDFMGEIEIPLSEIDEKAKRSWFPLRTKKGAKGKDTVVSGDLLLELCRDSSQLSAAIEPAPESTPDSALEPAPDSVPDAGMEEISKIIPEAAPKEVPEVAESPEGTEEVEVLKENIQEKENAEEIGLAEENEIVKEEKELLVPERELPNIVEEKEMEGANTSEEKPLEIQETKASEKQGNIEEDLHEEKEKQKQQQREVQTDKLSSESSTVAKNRHLGIKEEKIVKAKSGSDSGASASVVLNPGKSNLPLLAIGAGILILLLAILYLFM